MFWKVAIAAYLIYDYYSTARDIKENPKDPLNYVGLIPIPALKGSVKLVKAADDVAESGQRLYRFGVDKESAARLGRKAQEAEDSIGHHGVSVNTRPSANSRSAPRSEVERFFDVLQTGKDPGHHTVILPKPVTKETADLFNSLFK